MKIQCKTNSCLELLPFFLCFFILFFSGFADTLSQDSVKKIIASALYQTTVTKIYDPAYVALAYPNGDIPIERGVCTDVIIRAFRSIGIDLQELVHRDMQKNFTAYPKKWKLTKPDSNIDHRRVANLMCFFRRKGKSLKISSRESAYQPGDIVAWKIPGNLDHIGIVVDIRVKNSKRYKIVHNIGNGAELEDVLFVYKIIGHYRYFNN